MRTYDLFPKQGWSHPKVAHLPPRSVDVVQEVSLVVAVDRVMR